MSTPALYVLAGEYRAAAARLADLDLDPQTIADTLESLSGDLEQKAQNVALMVRSLEATAASVKEWAGDATKRAKAIEARAESMRQYLAHNLEAANVQKVEGPGVCLSFRASTAVVVDNAEQLPAEFMRQPETPPPAPDKVAIGAALKAGRDVPGARLEQRRNLQIK